MKNFTRTIYSVVQLLVLGPTIACAQTWVTVDDYQFGGVATYGAAVATGSNGAVFAAGTSGSSPGGITGIVRRSLDGGAMWETVDTSPDWYEIHAMAVSPLGPVVVVGATRPIQPDGPVNWFTRLSEDGGSTWATVDNFVYLPDSSCQATAVDVAADGTIYVGGVDNNTGRWLVRRRLAASQAWATVVNLKHPNGYMGPLWGIKVARSGIFLAGVFSTTGGAQARWRVVRSTNQLASLQIVDDWLAAGSFQCHPRALTEDSNGNLIVVGRRAFEAPGQVDWVTRRSIDGGNTWSLVDQIPYLGAANAVAVDPAGGVWATGDFYPWPRMSRDGGATWTNLDSYSSPSRPFSRAAGIASDRAGNIYVVGYRSAFPDPSHWVTLKLESSPAISCERIGSTLRLSWSLFATNFVLQSATMLANGGDWQDSGLLPTEINGQQVVTITPTGASGFFRLRRP